MKKSKVIIPAMALLLFSTAASITGTVAWFTSNRVFNTSAGVFQATVIDGNLDVDLTGGTATHVEDANHNAPTDAEYNKATGKIVTNTGAKFADSSFLPTPASGDSTFWHYTPTGAHNFESRGLTTNLEYSTNVYFAASWTMRFNYTYGEDATPMNIYLDTRDSNGSQFTNSDAAQQGKTHQAIKGFRIAFVCSDGSSGTKTVIWADKQESSKCLHITGADVAETGTAYSETGTTLISATSTTRDSALATDGANPASFHGYIGQIPTAASGSTSYLDVTCYAWFEGTDENIVNDAQLNLCSATMKFYARTNAAAPVNP